MDVARQDKSIEPKHDGVTASRLGVLVTKSGLHHEAMVLIQVKNNKHKAQTNQNASNTRNLSHKRESLLIYL